jgi:3-oxoacid CoA-transferase
VADIASGSRLLAAGFGWSGAPDTLIAAIAKLKDVGNLEGVSNNAGKLSITVCLGRAQF